jgi:hypothetical protein
VQAFTDAGDYVATYGGAKAGMGFAFGLALQQPPGRPNPLLFASTVSPVLRACMPHERSVGCRSLHVSAWGALNFRGHGNF